MSVSVIIPCYNCERFIAEGIDSVLAQTLKDREVIVVDDGSIDGSAEMVRARYSSTVTVLHQGNKGAAAARNAGARAARCKHLMFLDADDTIGPRFLEGLYRALIEKDADLGWGRFVMVWPSGRLIDGEFKPINIPNDELLASVLSLGWTPPNAILWRTDFFWRIGGWDEALSVNDDGELIFRALLAEPRLARSEIDRAVYRQHEGPRLSGQTTRTAMVSQVSVLEKAVSALGDRARTPVLQRALSRSSYETSRKLYELGYDDLAIRCEGLWRGLGAPYIRTGSLANQFASGALGLKMKTALARALRRAKVGLE